MKKSAFAFFGDQKTAVFSNLFSILRYLMRNVLHAKPCSLGISGKWLLYILPKEGEIDIQWHWTMPYMCNLINLKKDNMIAKHNWSVIMFTMQMGSHFDYLHY